MVYKNFNKLKNIKIFLYSSGFTPAQENSVVSRVFFSKWVVNIKEKCLKFFGVQKRHNKNTSPFFCAGFTLVEIVVTIGIIGLISSVVITGGNKGLDQRKIILESRRLAEDIRKVQNMALSSVTQDCGALGVKVAPSGIILDTGSNDRYLLVTDCNENKIYDNGDILLSTTRLSSTRITLLVPASPLNIFFIPPLPQTSVNTDTLTTAEIRICGVNDITVCRHTYINPRGSVTVQAN